MNETKIKMGMFVLFILFINILVGDETVHFFTSTFSEEDDDSYIFTQDQLYSYGNIAIESYDDTEYDAIRWVPYYTHIEYYIEPLTAHYSLGLTMDKMRLALQESINMWNNIINISTNEFKFRAEFLENYSDADHTPVWVEVETDVDDLPFWNDLGATCYYYNSNNWMTYKNNNNESMYIRINGTSQFNNEFFYCEWENQTTSHDFLPLLTVMAHEVGHTLGIGHIFEYNSDTNNYIMSPTHGVNKLIGSLTEYDILSAKALYWDGGCTPTDDTPQLPEVALSNYPNPFKISGANRDLGTTISYSLAQQVKEPKIEIFNIRGQRVKSYKLEEKSGKNDIVWKGKDVC